MSDELAVAESAERTLSNEPCAWRSARARFACRAATCACTCEIVTRFCAACASSRSNTGRPVSMAASPGPPALAVVVEETDASFMEGSPAEKLRTGLGMSGMATERTESTVACSAAMRAIISSRREARIAILRSASARIAAMATVSDGAELCVR